MKIHLMILLCFILFNSTLFASITNLLTNNQEKILYKIIYLKPVINKNIYSNFWNDMNNNNMQNINELEKKIKNELLLKLEIWKSAKLSFKLMKITKTSYLEKKYLKFSEKDKNEVFKILFSAVERKELKISKNKNIKMTLLFIENMIEKQKNALIAISYLFKNKYKAQDTIEFKNEQIKVPFTTQKGYEYVNNEFNKLIYFINNNNNIVLIKEIPKNIVLKQCILYNSYKFYKDNPTINKINKKYFSTILKYSKNFIHIECINFKNKAYILTVYNKNKNNLDIKKLFK